MIWLVLFYRSGSHDGITVHTLKMRQLLRIVYTAIHQLHVIERADLVSAEDREKDGESKALLYLIFDIHPDTPPMNVYAICYHYLQRDGPHLGTFLLICSL